MPRYFIIVFQVRKYYFGHYLPVDVSGHAEVSNLSYTFWSSTRQQAVPCRYITTTTSKHCQLTAIKQLFTSAGTLLSLSLSLQSSAVEQILDTGILLDISCLGK